MGVINGKHKPRMDAPFVVFVTRMCSRGTNKLPVALRERKIFP